MFAENFRRNERSAKSCDPLDAPNATPNCTRSFALQFPTAHEGVVQPRFGDASARIQGVTGEVML